MKNLALLSLLVLTTFSSKVQACASCIEMAECKIEGSQTGVLNIEGNLGFIMDENKEFVGTYLSRVNLLITNLEGQKDYLLYDIDSVSAKLSKQLELAPTNISLTAKNSKLSQTAILKRSGSKGMLTLKTKTESKTFKLTDCSDL